MIRKSLTGATLTLFLALSLAACGSSASDTASSDSAAGSDSASAGGQAGPGGGNNEQFQQIQECLTAAGIDLPDRGERPTAMPTAMPSGASGERPTDMPTDMPTGASGERPSGAPSGAPGEGRSGGLNDILADENAQAALKACGLEAPTARPTATAS